jgi:hypothetical protein
MYSGGIVAAVRILTTEGIIFANISALLAPFTDRFKARASDSKLTAAQTTTGRSVKAMSKRLILIIETKSAGKSSDLSVPS